MSERMLIEFTDNLKSARRWVRKHVELQYT